MGLLTIILIALALAMDAFAVSVASGIAIKELRIRHALIIGAWFGLFQAVMPILGWVSGIGLRSLITGIDHWIVFGLLFLIGCKMIYESFQLDPMKSRTDPMQIHVLFSLSIATSLDAFAAGVSFAMLGISIMTPIIIIGAVTFILSFTGVLLGDRGSHFFEKRMEMAAGIILIAIGVKILIDHLMAG
ncbi:MAG TPA: manganese efflux pump MntP family protein [Desulfatiglandales bacterium]|nr:manganese efflux pump MntP family protein [Desulfatiglandales bacterium]